MSCCDSNECKRKRENVKKDSIDILTIVVLCMMGAMVLAGIIAIFAK